MKISKQRTDHTTHPDPLRFLHRSPGCFSKLEFNGYVYTCQFILNINYVRQNLGENIPFIKETRNYFTYQII